MIEIINILDQMKNSTVSNYIIAGLDSSLIGGKKSGKVRLFENHRHQHNSITPHSHRFDFTCLVLEGRVVNRTWIECQEGQGDFYEESTLLYKGKIGEYEKLVEGRSYYDYRDKSYHVGGTYSLNADEIHSVTFSKDAKVLFFEGPEVSDTSVILEPVVNGLVIPTCVTQEWMFVK